MGGVSSGDVSDGSSSPCLAHGLIWVEFLLGTFRALEKASETKVMEAFTESLSVMKVYDFDFYASCFISHSLISLFIFNDKILSFFNVLNTILLGLFNGIVIFDGFATIPHLYMPLEI
jgi:hypothetical protein